jgi:hypothetical protein
MYCLVQCVCVCVYNMYVHSVCLIVCVCVCVCDMCVPWSVRSVGHDLGVLWWFVGWINLAWVHCIASVCLSVSTQHSGSMCVVCVCVCVCVCVYDRVSPRNDVHVSHPNSLRMWFGCVIVHARMRMYVRLWMCTSCRVAHLHRNAVEHDEVSATPLSSVNWSPDKKHNVCLQSTFPTATTLTSPNYQLRSLAKGCILFVELETERRLREWCAVASTLRSVFLHIILRLSLSKNNKN